MLLLGTLLAGTLQIGLFRDVFYDFMIPGTWAADLQNWLDGLIPPDPSLGIEGVSVHGLFLIGLLLLIGMTSIKGFKNIYEGFSIWTYISLGLITLTLLVAAFSIVTNDQGLLIGFNGRFVAETLLLAAAWWMMAKKF